MIRKVRRVPENWQHPKDINGEYIPLFEGYKNARDIWIKEKLRWDDGFYRFFSDGEDFLPISDDEKNTPFKERKGECPDKTDYMPEWTEEEKTHFQMYEETSEGTPISPVMKTPEELAKWLTDNNVSYFANITTTYTHWLDICCGYIGRTGVILS